MEEIVTSDDEEEEEMVAAEMGNLTIDIEVPEEEVAKNLQGALQMKIEEKGGNVVKGEEGGDGTQRALGALEFLAQDAEPSRTTLIDARNGIKKLSRLEMLWTVRHCCPAGARSAFNCHRHWAQLLLHQPGEPPVTILSIGGIT